VDLGVCERRKLSVNVAKRKVMRLTRNDNVDDIEMTLDGIRMEEVDCFIYLGVDIDRDGGMKNEMKHRVTEEEKVNGVLWKIWKGEGVSIDSKKYVREHISQDLIIAIIRFLILVPTLLYDGGVWAIAEDRRSMGVMEMRWMGAMCGVSIMYRVRNAEVWL
jgi:hypothetical protein